MVLRHAPWPMSRKIEGLPASALIGSKNRIKDSQTRGANQPDKTTSGKMASAAPIAEMILSGVLDNPTARHFVLRLKTVSVKRSAVSNIAGEMVANAQSNPIRSTKRLA